MTFKNLITISRPRFWLYVVGPFIVGVAAAHQGFSLLIFLMAIYFTLPANLLIYGVNDIFDYETDKLNPKKGGYEDALKPSHRKDVTKMIILTNVPFLILLPLLNSTAFWSLLGFWFFGVFYSARPIRAKTKPLLDSFFNILYVFPGLFAYGLLTGNWPSQSIIIAATLWCMAMHAFSAIPDIKADKRAKINTIATFLGKQATILFCAAAYITAAVLVSRWLGLYSLACGAIYGVLMLLAFMTKNDKQLFKIYTYFPYINAMLGFGLFLVAILA